MMNITERIQSLEKFGIKPGLERISTLLHYLNNPEKAYKSIVVGGTNGKGSTCAMIDSILRSAGYRTGLYTSPHLVSMNERIKVNGEIIDNPSFNATAEQLFDMVGRHTELSSLTYFEFMTAAAILYFNHRKIDIALLEVGMGGRFDATNVVQPDVSVITNISLDHQQYLGTTVQEIAVEKAGIIRPGRPFITTDRNPASRQVLEDECQDKGGIPYFIDRDFSTSGDQTNMVFYNNKRTIRNLQLHLKGRHQIYNAAAAIQAVLLFGEEGIKITDNEIRDGLLKTSWPGRFEIIKKNPDMILDAGHNPAGIQTLVQAVKDIYLTPFPPPDQGESRPVTVVFAVSKDKDWHTMATMLSEITDTFVVTSYEGERSTDPEELGHFIRSNRSNGSNRADVVLPSKNAIQHALAITPDNGVIIVTGSIFLIGEIKREMQV